MHDVFKRLQDKSGVLNDDGVVLEDYVDLLVAIKLV